VKRIVTYDVEVPSQKSPRSYGRSCHECVEAPSDTRDNTAGGCGCGLLEHQADRKTGLAVTPMSTNEWLRANSLTIHLPPRT